MTTVETVVYLDRNGRRAALTLRTPLRTVRLFDDDVMYLLGCEHANPRRMHAIQGSTILSRTKEERR